MGESRRLLDAHLKKQQVTIPLDLDVLTYFNNDGKGLLTHINASLAKAG